jgi:hypothetical protein
MNDHIKNYCCELHNGSLIVAREAARRAGIPPQTTKAERDAQDAIEKHIGGLSEASKLTSV